MKVVRGEPAIKDRLPTDGPYPGDHHRPRYVDAEIEATRRRRFAKAMALAKSDLGMTDEERYELAQMLPGVDKDYGGSWKDLNPKQLHDLITMMEGFIYIAAMVQQRVGD